MTFKEILKPLKPLWILWIKFGNLLGRINATIILSLLYLLIITPMGIIRKFFGKDEFFINTKNQKSYWVDFPYKEPSVEHSSKQF